jgi:sarcosine oxidase subunit alpha
MPDRVTLLVNGEEVIVPAGTSVAAAILAAGISEFRRSVSGESRGPLCGMGICFECRVSVDGERARRSCQMPCRDGMRVVTE